MFLLCLRTSKILSLGEFVRGALGERLLVQNISYFMILMLTEHPSYSFSCLTPYICVFCRNKENKMKSKQFGQDLKKLCKEEAVVVTIGQCKKETVLQRCSVVATATLSRSNYNSHFAVWS